MSGPMNSHSITDYILKLEKENSESRTRIKQLEKDLIGSEIRRVSDVISEADQYKSTVDKLKKENSESRTKIEQLKKLYAQAEDEKVDALSALTDFKYKTNCLSKSSYTDSTARVCGKSPYCKTRANSVIVERLLELGEMTSDFYKTGAYHCAADTIAKLEYVVESGESVRHLSGIGKSISAKLTSVSKKKTPTTRLLSVLTANRSPRTIFRKKSRTRMNCFHQVMTMLAKHHHTMTIT